MIVDAIGHGGFLAPADLIRRSFEIRSLQQHRDLLRAFLRDGWFFDECLTIRQTYRATVTDDLDLARVGRAGEVENCAQRAGFTHAGAAGAAAAAGGGALSKARRPLLGPGGRGGSNVRL